MAQVNGKNLALIAAGKKIPGGEINGRVKVLHESYTFAADVFAATDEILGPSLPAGATVIDAYVAAPSLGATGIFSLGHKAAADVDGNVVAEDPDAFVAAADFGGAAALARAGVSGKEAGLLSRFRTTQEVQTFLTCTEVTATADTLVIDYVITYTID